MGRRDKWLSVIKKQDLTGDKIRYAAVCFDHFISGKVTMAAVDNEASHHRRRRAEERAVLL